MRSIESQSETATKLERIAWISAKNSTKTFAQLMHHVNVDSLQECYKLLDGSKAVGIDTVTKVAYGKQLGDNLQMLVSRMKQMAYRPAPVREVRLPKETLGEYRSLGISNFEDKIVQKQFQRILESIYEPIFKDCSYGFRQNRSAHDAVRALYKHLYRGNVRMVIDVDLASYFDMINHKMMEEFLKLKIKDKRFLRYINRMFKAGILTKGELKITDEGVPQGNILSPVLANIFAHYVIDMWFENTVKSHCRGEVELYRYCDDMVILCQCEKDAHRIKIALAKRLDKFKLQVNENKTKLIRFSTWTKDRSSFDFLGFTFYWGKSQKGHKILKLRTSGKRMRSKLKKVHRWAKFMRHKADTVTIWKCFCRKLQGHIRYYGVTHNMKQLNILALRFFLWF